MPEMKDLHGVGILQNAVVDQDRSMHELPNAWPACHLAANVRKASEQIDVIQNRVAELFSCVGKVEP